VIVGLRGGESIRGHDLGASRVGEVWAGGREGGVEVESMVTPGFEGDVTRNGTSSRVASRVGEVWAGGGREGG